MFPEGTTTPPAYDNDASGGSVRCLRSAAPDFFIKPLSLIVIAIVGVTTIKKGQSSCLMPFSYSLEDSRQF